MQQALDRPDQRLRTCTATFTSQILPGPIDVDVEVLREGRSMSQLRATVRGAGDGPGGGHVVVAAWGADRTGFSFTGPEPPVAKPRDECIPGTVWRDERPADWAVFEASFWEHFESAMSEGHIPWMHAWEPGSGRRVSWIRWLDTPRLADGTVDPLALVPLLDTMPGAVAEHLGADGPMFLAPSVDLTVHLLAPTAAEWFVQVNRARHAGDGYASAELELWDETGQLVAYATQMMLVSFPPPA